VRVSVDRALYERCERHARDAGYSGVEELVAHALERLLGPGAARDETETVTRRLQGLGYVE
jgi:hypothetical protein